MSPWKRIEDEKPKEGNRLLCVGTSGGLFITGKTDQFSLVQKKGMWTIWDINGKWRRFTHWMYVPELPEGGRK